MKENIASVKKYLETIGNFIYKYRFILAIFIFIICIIFEIHFSSINCFNIAINSGVSPDKNLLLGTAKYIRADEWAVTTPMLFSQKFNNFGFFSELIRADKTETFSLLNLPVLSWFQIFRPFQLGYLFLGIAKGMSFFWVGRLLALLLVTFEFFMIFTKKNKLLSFLGMLMITFGPQVQWWGIAEIFIFGLLAIILLYKYVNTEDFKKRIFYLIGMILCAGAYILILYPPYQIAMFYVFLILAIWIIIDNRKNCKISLKDIISIIIATIILSSCIGYIFYKASDTVKATSSTVYPGSRISTGGEQLEKLFYYPMNIFLPEKKVGLEVNQCESAVMFSLFPIGLIISIWAMIKNKKTDLELILLQIIYIFLGIYCIIGFPEILAKITLMSSSTPERAFVGVGVLDILILFKGIMLTEKHPKTWLSILISLGVSTIIVVGCKIVVPEYIDIPMFLIMYIILTSLFFFVLNFHTQYGKICFTIGIIIVMILAGFRIIPVSTGVEAIYESPIIKEIQRINSEESGKWIVCDIGFPMANYVLTAGVPVINSTNVYPNLERWHKLDGSREYENVYNRYAHIRVNLKKSEDEFSDKFDSTATDSFAVNIIPEDLKTLDVKYIVTTKALKSYNTETVTFEAISFLNGYILYKVNY